MTNTTAWLIVALTTLTMASCAAAQDSSAHTTEADMARAAAADLSDAQAQARAELRALLVQQPQPEGQP